MRVFWVFWVFRSQPVPVGSGAISPACTVSVSGASDDHMLCRPVNDRSQPVPVGSGAILPAHTDLVSESTTFTTTTSASTTTISQPHPTYVLRSTTSASPSAPEFSSVRLRPPSAELAPSPSFDLNSADLAPSPSFDLNSSAHQSCPSPTDLASFPPLGSSS